MEGNFTSGSAEELTRDIIELLTRGYDVYCRTRVCFLLYGPIMICICTAGLVGNVISVAVLCKLRPFQHVFSLVVLNCLDSLVLTTSVLVYCPFAYCEAVSRACSTLIGLVPALYPFSLILRTAAIFVCCAISVERYFAIAKPFLGQSARFRKIYSASLAAIFLFAILYNIPSFYELSFDPKNRVLRATSLRSNRTYFLVYRGLMSTIVDFVAPLAVISVLSTMNVRRLVQTQTLHRELTQNQVQRRFPREFVLASLFIVLFFVLSQVVPLINHLAEWLAPTFAASEAGLMLVHFGNASVALGSAANFFAYCAAGSRFRQQLRRLFGRSEPRAIKALTERIAELSTAAARATIPSRSPRPEHIGCLQNEMHFEEPLLTEPRPVTNVADTEL